MEASDRRELGASLFNEVMGRQFPPPDDPFTEFVVDGVFAELWSRPGLTRKERRWITLALTATTSAPLTIRPHLRAALASGDITPEELREFVLHVGYYAGMPRASVLESELRALLAEEAATTAVDAVDER
jgi:4-carboxymuconolactone decarboxylase